MKNLIDELHELDNYEYKVSKDFSKNVMKRIKKEKNKFNYAISIASVGIVACFALVLVTNSNFESNIFNVANEIANHNMESDVLNKAFDNASDSFSEYQLDNTINNITGTSGIEAPNATAAGNINGVMAEAMKDKQENLKESSLDEVLRENKDIDEIVKILKNANLSLDVENEEIKVKSTKEEINKLLKDYKNIEIIEEGAYIFIKIK